MTDPVTPMPPETACPACGDRVWDHGSAGCWEACGCDLSHTDAAYAAGTQTALAAAPEVCRHGDRTCPCADGDICHYEGPDAARCPQAIAERAAVVEWLRTPHVGDTRASYQWREAATGIERGEHTRTEP